MLYQIILNIGDDQRQLHFSWSGPTQTPYKTNLTWCSILYHPSLFIFHWWVMGFIVYLVLWELLSKCACLFYHVIIAKMFEKLMEFGWFWKCLGSHHIFGLLKVRNIYLWIQVLVIKCSPIIMFLCLLVIFINLE